MSYNYVNVLQICFINSAFVELVNITHDFIQISYLLIIRSLVLYSCISSHAHFYFLNNSGCRSICYCAKSTIYAHIYELRENEWWSRGFFVCGTSVVAWGQ